MSPSGTIAATLTVGRDQPDALRAAEVSGAGVNDLLFSGTFDIETGGTGPGVVLGNGLGGYSLNADGRFGLAAIGDQNGDGLAELLVGASDYGPAGAAFLVFGTTDHAPVLVADLLARIGGVALLGSVPGARFGENSGALPDMNDDGLLAMCVGDSGFQGGRGQVICSNANWLV